MPIDPHRYDRDSDPMLAMVVYDGVHQGCELANIGGIRALEYLVSVVNLGAKSRVLELGCGVAAASFLLQERTNCEIVGVDIHEPHIDQARRAARELPLDRRERSHFEVADVSGWRLRPPADLVLVLDSMSQIDPTLAAATASRSLRPGGQVFVTDFTKGPAFDSDVERWLRTTERIDDLSAPRDLSSALLRAGFRIDTSVDMTDVAIDFCAAIHEVTEQRQTEILDVVDPSVVDEWNELWARYHEGFKSRALEYWYIVGRKSHSA